MEELLLSRGYIKSKPSIFSPEFIKNEYLKAVEDDNGTKYHITVREWHFQNIEPKYDCITIMNSPKGAMQIQVHDCSDMDYAESVIESIWQMGFCYESEE